MYDFYVFKSTKTLNKVSAITTKKKKVIKVVQLSLQSMY